MLHSSTLPHYHTLVCAQPKQDCAERVKAKRNNTYWNHREGLGHCAGVGPIVSPEHTTTNLRTVVIGRLRELVLPR